MVVALIPINLVVGATLLVRASDIRTSHPQVQIYVDVSLVGTRSLTIKNSYALVFLYFLLIKLFNSSSRNDIILQKFYKKTQMQRWYTECLVVQIL